VNHSGVHFSVEDGKIRYAMGAIKGVGEQAVEHIIEVRGDKPFVFSNQKIGQGLDDIIAFIERQGMLRSA